ncbi:STAS domain-containing protein [Nocardioides sp. zg-1228]|uniref:STAS domain-containing protein n=1 Tax=Nocardioides sp. zg-1228 TaxID=2763008 RepID=UPI0016430AC2|nr:STAS domain-containing protein [Nocardioides sp. zg-1228]QSF59068.1 anti-sigma factor antagonist [Nocardioides sp. zg-1228]
MSHHVSSFHFAGPDHLIAPAELDLAAVPDLVRSVQQAHRNATGRCLTVDLSGVVRMDPRLVRSLTWASRFTRCHGGRMRIVPPRTGVLTPLATLALLRHCAPTVVPRHAQLLDVA